MHGWSNVNFAVLGDFCLSGRQIESAFSDQSIDYWKPIKDLVGHHTPLIANLECPITEESKGRPKKYANLRASRKVAHLASGLSLAVIGNNHISDFGDPGVRDTVAILESLGVPFVGYGNNIQQAFQARTILVDRFRLGVISLCCPTTNGENTATHLSPGVAPISTTLLREAILLERDNCDALIVYFHWGPEHVHEPVPDQIRLGRYAIDCGADAVLGCHSHTIQTYEKYRGRWIFHGLGNLLLGDVDIQRLGPDGTIVADVFRTQPLNRESMVVKFAIRERSENGRLSLEDLLFLQYADDFLPKPVSSDSLTFNLARSNEILSDYSARCAARLSEQSEPNYRCHICNGLLTYFYPDPPISSLHLSAAPPTIGLLSRFKNYTRRSARYVANMWRNPDAG